MFTSEQCAEFAAEMKRIRTYVRSMAEACRRFPRRDGVISPGNACTYSIASIRKRERQPSGACLIMKTRNIMDRKRMPWNGVKLYAASFDSQRGKIGKILIMNPRIRRIQNLVNELRGARKASRQPRIPCGAEVSRTMVPSTFLPAYLKASSKSAGKRRGSSSGEGSSKVQETAAGRSGTTSETAIPSRRGKARAPDAPRVPAKRPKSNIFCDRHPRLWMVGASSSVVHIKKTNANYNDENPII